MNEKQILKEIAYYSRIINDHKKWHQKPHYSSSNTYKQESMVSYDLNKYKYVKKDQPSVITPVQESISTKVLINPNFRGCVHINPHFNVTKVNSKNIHVNPKILNTMSINFMKKCRELQPQNNSSEFIKPVISRTTSTSSRLKTPIRKRRLSIRSKYKIVKNNSLKTQIAPSNKFSTVKNQYKIDRRTKETLIKWTPKKKLFRQSLSDTLRETLYTNKTWKKSTLKTDRFKVNNMGSLKILPKTSRNKTQCNKFKKYLVSLRGKKYVMDSSKKTLKLITSPVKGANNTVRRISIKGITYVRKSAYTYVKSNEINNSRLSKHKRFLTNTLSKNNQPCPVYHRFGSCRRKDAGRCIFTHNPNQIAVCKRFLQGACMNKDCLLSHKVSLEKMPTCKYFLEGYCVRTDCPYLHVKINPNADICKNFLEGFCKDAVKCEKRHQYLCPDFERYGKCAKRRCLYPHKSKNVKEKCINEKPITNCKTENTDSVEVARYYDDAMPRNDIKVKPIAEVGEVEVSNVNPIEPDADKDVCKRPKLGILPSFIPFD